MTSRSLIKNEVEQMNPVAEAFPAEHVYINVTETGAGRDLPGGVYDWSEWAIAIIRIEQRNNGDDIVAYRLESSEVNEDWKIGTVEDAVIALDDFVAHCWDIVRSDVGTAHA